MKASFQILTQPWIPVKELDGSMKELSLLETLERAHLLSEIQDPSPMVEYSVYRFLIVFLMDMLRPDIHLFLTSGRQKALASGSLLLFLPPID